MEKKRIVVGFDGSAGARRALRWAMEEARIQGASLHIVHSWHYPYVGDYLPLAETVLQGTENVAERTLDQGVTEASTAPDLEVTGELVQGPPAQALIDAADGAELLVVGSRGHGGFGGLLLGSVSIHCAHHARCPVVIVPPPHE